MGPLLALDADFYATFEDESLMTDFDYLTSVLNAAHGVLLGSGRRGSIDKIEADRARAILKCATAQRRLMIAKMSEEMELAKASVELHRRLKAEAAALPDGIT